MVRLAAQTRVWCDRGRVKTAPLKAGLFLPMPPLVGGRGKQDARLHQTLSDALWHLSPLPVGTVSRRGRMRLLLQTSPEHSAQSISMIGPIALWRWRR
jgi:hypothetical protein